MSEIQRNLLYGQFLRTLRLRILLLTKSIPIFWHYQLQTFTISHFSPRNIFFWATSYILCGCQYLVPIPILLSCIPRIAILTKCHAQFLWAVFEKIAFEDFTSGEKYSNIAHCNTDKNVMHTVLSPIILSDSKYPRSAPPDFRNKYFNYCRIAGTGTDTETVTPLYYQEKNICQENFHHRQFFPKFSSSS